MSYLVAIGANSPAGRAANVRRVLWAMRALPGRPGAFSRLYRTPAWPPGRGQPDFVNAVARVHAAMAPPAMLARLHRIEAAAGRSRGERWGGRTLDLDLIGAGRLVRPDVATLRDWMALDPAAQLRKAPDGLILPHPRLADRAFVLMPLCDVAPGWRHPLTGRTARAMAAALPAVRRREVRSLGGLAVGGRPLVNPGVRS